MNKFFIEMLRLVAPAISPPWILTTIGLSGLLVSVSCSRPTLPPEFEKNYVYAYRVSLAGELPMEQVLKESSNALRDLFGSPDSPKLPEVLAENEDLKQLVKLERLQRASGPAGLYQEHCLQCHGRTGEGRGLAAALLDPYPRDYRMGTFKFKTTPRGSKPTRADLANVIRRGVPGTGMKPIEKLTNEDIECLVDYVIYLSWRGEVERALLNDCGEIDWESESLYDPAIKLTNAEAFVEQTEFMNEHVIVVGEKWLDAAGEVVDIELPKSPLMFSAENASDPEVQASIARGKQVFLGPIAACAKCHGNEGKGDGQTTDYDDWAKDWTLRANLKPTDEKALIPLMARGALPPRVIRPRNFQEGLFRGGSDPTDLYRRILLGIDGTPMPATTLKSATVEIGLTEQDLWDLVNFVRSLGTQPSAEIR